MDDGGNKVRFLSDASTASNDIPEDKLWDFFKKPVVRTVAEVNPAEHARLLSLLDSHEVLSNFEYYPGQKDYIARHASRDSSFLAGDVGVGKSLMAVSLILLKGAKRVLLIAPKGTIEGTDYDPSQWFDEIRYFAPGYPIHELYGREDLNRLTGKGRRELPEGVFITYPEAFFLNRAEEHIGRQASVPDFCERYELPFNINTTPDYLDGVGDHNRHGVYGIIKPSLMTLCGDVWDMVLLDEAHLVGCNPATQRGKSLLRLRATYRYALSATPFPNYVSDVFAIMGWLAVEDWYCGRRNVVWPYAPHEFARYKGQYLTRETDTTERARLLNQGQSASAATKLSTIISKPARLLKLLRPLLVFISKEQCNPRLVGCETIDVRVPMGTSQRKLYEQALREPAENTLARYGNLRNLCADPATCNYNLRTDRPLRSNFNPKLMTILQLVQQCLEKGEQVLVTSSRVGQTDEIARRLGEAQVDFSRIDSTSRDHAHQSNEFKAGHTRVMLMGVKCAVGHSFSNCPNMIIGSLEWSFGALHQAKGRVWRLNSPRPVKIWCVLNADSIEELMFDKVARKGDAATLCLHGRRVSREFVPLQAADVLSDHLSAYAAGSTQDEAACEKAWPELREWLTLAVTLDPEVLRAQKALQGKAVAVA